MIGAATIALRCLCDGETEVHLALTGRSADGWSTAHMESDSPSSNPKDVTK